MVQTTLLFAGVVTLLVALAYAYVGLRLPGRRSLTEPAGRAMAFFSLWWLATAANQAGGSTLYIAAALGWTDLDVQIAYVVVQRVLLAISLVGLMYYLLYVFSGRSYLVPLVAAYTVFALLSIYTVLAREPQGVLLWDWRTDLDYAKTISGAFDLANFVFILLPPVLGSLALWRLYPRVATRGQRVRIAAVSIGFVLWWVYAILVGRQSTFDNDLIQGFNRVLGLTVALVILFAYEPTPWMQRRFGLDPYRAPSS